MLTSHNIKSFLINRIFKDKPERFFMLQKIAMEIKGGNTFQAINRYFEANYLIWTHYVAICTDGAAALTMS